MDEERWEAFDRDLRIRIEGSKQARYETSQPAAGKIRELNIKGESQEISKILEPYCSYA